MSEHTPGPWQVEPDFTRDVDNYDVVADMGDYSAVIARVFFTGDDAVRHNASLIAAAPQLLEVCKMLVHAYEKSGQREKMDYAVREANKLFDAMEES